MANAFLLDDKSAKYFQTRYSVLVKAMKQEDLTFETLTGEDIAKITKHIKPSQFSAKSILKKADALLSGKRFSLMYIEKYRPSPREWTQTEDDTQENEFVFSGQLTFAYREWYYTKREPDESLPFGVPTMEPIEEEGPAYKLLEKRKSWGDSRKDVILNESDIAQIQKYLGLEEYPYIETGESYKIEILASICAQMLQVQPQKTKQLATLLSDVKLFYNLPDSPASDLLYEILGAGADIESLPARKKLYNNNAKLKVNPSQDGKKRKVTLDSQKAKVVVEIADIDKFTGSNKAAKKLFVLALIKANEQAIHNGQLTRDYVTFPLNELIEIGFYKTTQSARAGFKAAMGALTDVKFSGEIERTKKQKTTVIGLHPFRVGIIDKNQCYIRLETGFNWSFLAQYFTILPRYYFRLPNKASDLLYYIFFLARQNTRDIQERGYFNISFRALQSRLQLPNESKARNPQRDIKDAIDEAIAALEEAHSKEYNNTEFQLLPVCDPTAPIKKYLDEGYLQIRFSGAFSETFIKISKDTAKRVEAANKKKSQILDKAMALNTAKALEQGTSAGRKP